MNHDKIFKRAILLSIPMMIQNGITNAVGLIDNLMVGSLGTESITAVSIAVQLVFVYSMAIFGGLSGPGIYTAQYYGFGDNEGIKHVFRLKLWVVLFCLICGVICFSILDEQLLGLYLRGEGGNIDTELTLSLAKEYLHIMLIGLLPFSITQVYATHMRETGDSFRPMIAGICSVLTDVVFNYLLIFGKFGFPQLGVRGAAIATVFSRVCEMAVIMIWAHKKKYIHKFLIGIYTTFLVPKNVSSPVIQRGLPIFINEFLWAGGVAALTQCYSLKGVEIVAGLNISNTICNLLNVVFIALGSAVGIIIGQLLGAHEYKLAKDSAIKLTWFTGALCIVLTIILIAIAGLFPMAYNTTEEIRNIGKIFIIITALYFPLQGILNSLYFTLRSGGKTIITFLFDGAYSWVVQIPFAYFLCLKTSLGIFAIYALVQAIDIIKTMVGYILVKKGVWLTNLVDN